MTQQSALNYINSLKTDIFALEVCKRNAWEISFREYDKRDYVVLMLYSVRALLAYVQASRDERVIEECCTINRATLNSVLSELHKDTAFKVVQCLKVIHDFALTELYGISEEESELYFIHPISGECINIITKIIVPRLNADAAQIMRGATDASESVIYREALPLKMDTMRARIAFSRAIKKRWMKKTRRGYKWTFEYGGEPRPTFAYFVTRIYKDKGTERVPSKELEMMFGIKGVSRAIYQVYGGKQWWRDIIDEIFKDL